MHLFVAVDEYSRLLQRVYSDCVQRGARPALHVPIVASYMSLSSTRTTIFRQAGYVPSLTYDEDFATRVCHSHSRYPQLHVRRARGQVLSLWSGPTGSRTLDYQRTSPREYQIVRTHANETTWIKDPVSPNHQQHHVQDTSSKQQNKTKIQTQSSAERITTSLSLVHQRKNKQKLGTNLSLYKAYPNHGTNLRKSETKRKQEFNLLQGKNSTFLEAWEKETPKMIS